MKYKAYTPPYSVPEILRLRADGWTYSKIAKHFGISRSRVGQIIKREDQRAHTAERSAAIRNEIRGCSDLGRKLPVDDLICALGLSPRGTTVFRGCMKRQGIAEFSLRDLMEFLIPIVDEGRGVRDRPDLDEHLRHMPAYGVRMLGQMLYAELIKAVSAVDCGDALRAEWMERKRRLREYLIGTRGMYLHILNGKQPALAPEP